MMFPRDGLVYDYALEDGGVSRKHSKDDDDEEEHAGEVRVFYASFQEGRGGEERKCIRTFSIYFEMYKSFLYENCYVDGTCRL